LGGGFIFVAALVGTRLVLPLCETLLVSRYLVSRYNDLGDAIMCRPFGRIYSP